MIEPFRPIVDLHVATHRKANDTQDLSPTDKVALVSLLNVDVAMPRGVMSVLAAVEQSTQSLARLYEEAGQEPLALPAVIGLNQHRAEM